MPEGLPGFGLYHDNLSQQGTGSWNRVISTHMVNMATVAISRLAMSHTTESASKNDIFDKLWITGTGFDGSKAWDTVVAGRDSLNWQIGRHSASSARVPEVHLAHVGFFQNRGYYQYTQGYTSQYAFNDGTGSALADFLLACRLRGRATPAFRR